MIEIQGDHVETLLALPGGGLPSKSQGLALSPSPGSWQRNRRIATGEFSGAAVQDNAARGAVPLNSPEPGRRLMIFTAGGVATPTLFFDLVKRRSPQNAPRSD